MKRSTTGRIAAGLVALLAVVLAGCAGVGGTPKAVSPETKVDFGDVPVTNNMNEAKSKEFVIRNEGTGNLKLSDLQVKLLQGC